MKTIYSITLAFLIVLTVGLSAGEAVIVPAGNTERPATQLIGWVNDVFLLGDTALAVTNTSNTSSVTIHVQVWMSDDGSGDPVTDPCFEVNFTDTLTPNDTHVYVIDQDFFANTDPCLTAGGCDGDDVILDLQGRDGFVTVTPVVSTTDRRAIAFNNLIGNITYEADAMAGVNTVGREARSNIDSSLLADGTILNGITTALVLIQPEVLKFEFSSFVNNDAGMVDDVPPLDPGFINLWSIVNIIFEDNYSGPFGDYRSQPASARFDTLIFNETEVPTSCQTFTPTCIIDQGINDDLEAENTLLSDPGPLLCPGNTLTAGWVRLAVTNIGGTENVLGIRAFANDRDQSYAGAVWMVAEGDKVFPSPATPTPSPSPSPSPDGDGDGGDPVGGDTPGGGGGGGGCAIAGPVQAGTAFANMLIVLLPAVGFALRRRFKKA